MNQPLTVEEIRNRIVEVRKLRFGDVANHPRNPKRHPDTQRNAFRGSVRELGFASVPIVYHSERNAGKLTFADGHLRGSEVADYVGDVAILDIDDAEADKLLLYADPIAAMAEYESQQLDGLLRDISTTDQALQGMLAGLAKEAGLYPDKVPVADPGPQIDKAEELRQKWGVEPGDLWILGNHRLICGDCTDNPTVERLMQGEKWTAIITDPPYGVNYEGGRNPESNTPRPKLAGDKDGMLYAAMLDAWNQHRANKGVLYLWFAASVGKPVYDAVHNAGYKIRAMIIWNKLDAHYGNFMAQYMQKHEPCLYCVKDGSNWYGATNEVTVWDIKQPTANENHPTEKPLECMARPISNSTKEGDIVCDPFLGSGTTLIACEQLGRQCRAVEISPGYVGVALERWSIATSAQPVRAA